MSNNYHERLLSSSHTSSYKSLEPPTARHLAPMHQMTDFTHLHASDNQPTTSTSHTSGAYSLNSPTFERASSTDALISTDTHISMGAAQPTNFNVISALKERASAQPSQCRVDNVFLYRSVPRFGDMFGNHETSAITLLHIGFALLSLILLCVGYALNIQRAFEFGTFIALLTNLFGIAHSMHSGAQSKKMSRLDAAIQNFAVILQKFAKALNIQEAYLSSVKNMLDFIDVNVSVDLGDQSQFVGRLKGQTAEAHKKWLLTFFGQYKLLDNRVGIRKTEYFAFVQKLPLRARMLFEALTGIESRFKRLDTSDAMLTPRGRSAMDSSYRSPAALDVDVGEVGDGEDTVLLYEDMTELVEKVLADMGAERTQSLQKPKHGTYSKALPRRPNANAKGYLLSERMSTSLARDAPQLQMKERVRPRSFPERQQQMRGVYRGVEDVAPDLMEEEREEERDAMRRSKTMPLRAMMGSESSRQRTLSTDEQWLTRVMSGLHSNEEEEDFNAGDQSVRSYKL